MRSLCWLLVTVFACGCGGTTSRSLPRSALLARARDPEPTMRGRRALAFAAAQIGRPYCWGGSGPSCFDCSGLVQSAWRTAGIALPRTSGDMGKGLSGVELNDIRPGDVLWWPGHVAIYAGRGLEIEALDGRRGIVERPATSPYRALRPD
jgi:cell wall-associated NlpC family hydrolase